MIPFQTHNALALPGINHGFFGRKGGVSSAPYDSLNAGYGSDDETDKVRENRTLIAGALGTSEPHLISLYQVHSRDVHIIDAPFDSVPPQADGLVTRRPGLAISALSADCGPVLMVDPEARVIGACHAGWRGALSGIMDATMTAMESEGAQVGRIIAVLGPCISQKAYEVGPEFRDQFISKNADYARFFISGAGDRLHFDLKGFIVARLKRAGVAFAQAMPDCTYFAPEDYFSYRFNTHQGISDYGRNISAIMLAG